MPQRRVALRSSKYRGAIHTRAVRRRRERLIHHRRGDAAVTLIDLAVVGFGRDVVEHHAGLEAAANRTLSA